MSTNLDIIINKLKKTERQRDFFIVLSGVLIVIVLVSLFTNFTSRKTVASPVAVESNETRELPKPPPVSIEIKKSWIVNKNLFSDEQKQVNEWKYTKMHDLMNGDTYIITQKAKLAVVASEFSKEDQATYLTLAIRFQSKGRKEVFFNVGYADLAASANTDEFPLFFKFDDRDPLSSTFSKGTNGSFFMDLNDIDSFFKLATNSKKCYIRFVRKDDVKMDIAIDCAGLSELINEK